MSELFYMAICLIIVFVPLAVLATWKLLKRYFIEPLNKENRPPPVKKSTNGIATFFSEWEKARKNYK